MIINPSNPTIGASGGDVTIRVTYNSPYTQIPPPDYYPLTLKTSNLISSDSNGCVFDYTFAVNPNLETSPKQFGITFYAPNDEETIYIVQAAGTATPTINILGNNPINVTNGSGSYNISVEYTNAGGPSYTVPIVTRGLQYVTASLISTSSNGGDFTGHYNIIVNPNHDTQAGVTGSVEFDVFDSPNGGNRLAYSVLDFYIPYTEEPTPPEPPTPPAPVITPEIQVNPWYAYFEGDGEDIVSVTVRYVGATETYWGYVEGPFYPTPYVSMSSYAHLGTDETSSTYRYDFKLQPNPYLESRDFTVEYSMSLSREYPGLYTTSSTLQQKARRRNPVIEVVSTNPITTTNHSIPITVEYSECGGSSNVGYAVTRGQGYATVTSAHYSNFVGETFRGDFSVDLTRDWQHDVTASITFFTLENEPDVDYASDTQDIYLPRDYSSQSIELVPPSRSVTWDTTATNVTALCHYATLSDQVSVSYNGNITSVTQTSANQSQNPNTTSSHEYAVVLAPNLTSQAVVSSITFTLAPSGVTATHYITQSAYDPTAYSIQAPEYIVVEAEGGNGIEVGTVVYSGITSNTQIGTETYSGNVGITSLDTVGSTNNSRTYTIDVTPNTGTTSLTSSLNWSIKDTPVTAVTKVYQKAPFLGIIVTPENSNVAYNNTSTTLYVTYSNALLYGYVTQSPVSTDDLTLVSSTTSGNHIYARYTLNYPANTGNSSISHTATFGMGKVGESPITKTATVNQSGIPSGQGISLNRTNQVIEYYETSTQVIATYYGISSIDSVALPTINSGEWTATIASYTESAGQVQVTWNIQGTTNPAAGARTITFTFSAAGISSTATFALVQNGTGSTQVVNNIIPAWKDTETEVGGDNWEVLAQDSRGIVLFDERIYRAPDRETLTVNFNRIAESFLEPREFPVISATTPTFYYTARFAGGPAYGWWVVDDWSYERENMNDIFALSAPYQNEIAGGQYIIFSALNVAEALPLTLNLNGYEVGNVEGAPYSYVDIVNRVIDCGEWEVKSGDTSLAKFRTTDAKYVIYYYNRFGGWDSFVVKGPVVPSVNTTRSNYLNYRRNTRTYQVGVVDSYKVSTGILLDSVSPVVGEMTASPRLILHDLKEDKLIPVKVTTNSVEVKTFRNQGRKFAEYQFVLEADKSKIRR